jgi:hypothetical protein
MKNNLTELTNLFFSMHWNIEEEKPSWDFTWNFIGPVPNYLLGGVYALLRGEEVIYIGLGASRGSGIYKDRGISRRLMSHVCLSAPKNSEFSVVLRERWQILKIDKVATLGFSPERNYLAAALEDFLISGINPIANTVKKHKE